MESYPEADPRRAAAVRLVLTGDTRATGAADMRMETFRRHIDGQGLCLALVVGVHSPRKPSQLRSIAKDAGLLTAAAVIKSPGRTGIVILPPLEVSRADGDAPQALVACLRHLIDLARQRAIVLIQALLVPGDQLECRLLTEAGFSFLAELIYADRRGDIPALPADVESGVQLLSYRPERHYLFLRGLEASYEGSRDCPRLTGMRRTEDVLAGHRATGLHDPDLWLVAVKDEQVLGILLLTRVPQRDGLEIVYMGVSRAARGRGVGDRLILEAVAEGRRRACPLLTLAVDSANAPARRLYARWGFVETERRLAWIADCRVRDVCEVPDRAETQRA
ncbi:MAG TPA: GNAT family N-acetyltransferase [Phycisphaerae bacterium]